MDRRIWGLLLLLVPMLASCAAGAGDGADAATTGAQDGGSAVDTASTQDAGDATGVDVSAPGPIFFGVMVHLEGAVTFPDQASLDRYNLSLKQIVDTFSAKGAKVTLESERSYLKALQKYYPAEATSATRNMLVYALEQGHGTGSHCDFGVEPGVTYAKLVSDYARNKAAVDEVVGAANNTGCSGGWSTADWARAAVEGGFTYLNAVVMFAYLAVPLEKREINPATGKPYSDEEIRSTFYHDSIPVDTTKAYYPRFVSSALDGIEDAPSGIVLLTGSLGEIASLAEGRSSCFLNCILDAADTKHILDTIDAFFPTKAAGRLAHMNIHFPVGTLRPATQDLVNDWLDGMAARAAAGKIAWKSQKEVADEYLRLHP